MLEHDALARRAPKRRWVHVGMLALIALAGFAAFSLRGCTRQACTEVSYLPGRCG